MSAVVLRCPECAGPRMVGHPAGLVVDHRNECSIRAAEDATTDADASRAHVAALPGFFRVVTPTERALLVHWGADPASIGLVECYWLTRSMRRRTFEGVRVDALPGPAVEQPGDAGPTGAAA